MTATAVFLAGMTTMGFIVAAIFFMSFWRRTRDGLFMTFGIAFFLLAINQGAIALSGGPRDEQLFAYALRIVAFGLLISAIMGKNIGGGGSGSRGN